MIREPKLWSVLIRFPAAVVAAVVAATLAVADALPGLAGGTNWWIAAFVIVLGWSVVLSLLIEVRGQGLPRLLRLAAPWLAGGFALWPVLGGAGGWPSGLILIGTATAAILAMPLLLLREGRAAAAEGWLRAVVLAVAVSGLAALAFSLGIRLLLWGVENLFGLSLPWWIDSGVASLAMFLLFPLCTLHLLPTLSGDLAGRFAFQRWLAALVRWLCIPLATAYGLLLNFYCLYVVVMDALPKGRIAAMVAGFALVGAFIWAATGSVEGRWPRLYRQCFFPGLVAPVVALVVAVWTRVETYGVTEERYLLLLLAGLLLLLALVQAIGRRVPSYQLAAAMAGMALLAAAFGPWGATGLSIRSQYGRLVSALTETGRLVDGLVSPTGAKLARGRAGAVSGMVDFLVARDESARVIALFRAPPTEGGSQCVDAECLVEAMGIGYLPYYHPDMEGERDVEPFYWRDEKEAPLDIAGFHLMVRTVMLSNEGEEEVIEQVELPDRVLDLALLSAPDRVEVRRDGAVIATMPLKPAISGLGEGSGNPVLEATTADGLRLRLVLTWVFGTEATVGEVTATNITGILLVGTER